MMTKKKQYMLIGIVTLLMGLLFFPIRTFAADTFDTTFSSLSSLLLGKSSSIDDIEGIIKRYCSSVLASDAFEDNKFVYSAKYSAFVFILCKQVDEGGSSLDPTLFKRSDFDQLGLVDYDVDGNDFCSPLGSNCNLAKHIPDLYNKIITDYVNMKQSNIYGLFRNASTDDEIENQVNVFSTGYFGIKICETSDRSYNETCRIMKSYIKNANTLLSDVSVFSGKVILDLTQSIIKNNSDICTNKFVDIENYDPLICGLYGDTMASLVSFENLVYNELFYYRLFVGYYLTMLQKQPGILTKSIYNNYSNISKKFSSEYTRSKSASSLTFRMLRDMYTAFPFHIGMLMYKEDLNGFGKALSAIAPPIYTLYDKLRNVQTPK